MTAIKINPETLDPEGTVIMPGTNITHNTWALYRVEPKIYKTDTKMELGIILDIQYLSSFCFSSTIQVNMGKMDRTLSSQMENT